jgi:hypothetical protein
VRLNRFISLHLVFIDWTFFLTATGLVGNNLDHYLSKEYKEKTMTIKLSAKISSFLKRLVKRKPNLDSELFSDRAINHSRSTLASSSIKSDFEHILYLIKKEII